MIIGLSGKIRSGKTTAAMFFQSKYHFQVLKSSSLLASILKSRDAEVNRENLQQLGKNLVATVGAGGFIAIMLEYLPEGDYVVDSIRYVGAVSYLRRRYGANYCHIHVKATDKARYLRMKADQPGKQITYFRKIDEAETEKANPALQKAADFVVENNGSVEELDEQLSSIYDQLKIRR